MGTNLVMSNTKNGITFFNFFLSSCIFYTKN